MTEQNIYPANIFQFNVEAQKLKRAGFNLCRIKVIGERGARYDFWQRQIGEGLKAMVKVWYPVEF